MELGRPIVFLATDDPAKSRTFYEDTLGLRFVADDPYALVFKAGDVTLRIQKVDTIAAVPYTVFGFEVSDINATIQALKARSVAFETYAHIDQDESGIWRTPSGASVAWFRDPVGNLLSLTQPR